ncbi:MAG: SDR family oxidoreductase [Rubellimicrobium sp.]|nr:SDR family oxidoreductase [Rubellimicrobium sp.]
MSGRLEGKVAVVIGAAGGIGQSVAESFAREGAKVVIGDSKEAEGRAVAQAIGGDFLATDVGRHDDVQALVDFTIARHGRLDIAVQNAGIYPWQLIEDTSPGDWDRVLGVNLGGCFNLARAALAPMKAQGGGRILFTSSITGPRVVGPGHGHYAASKAGINGLIRAAALEFSAYGITVNGVEPGNILTDAIRLHRGAAYIADMEASIPLGRLGSTRDVANAFVFLASDDASYITGTTIIVDGGQILPEGNDFRIEVKSL